METLAETLIPGTPVYSRDRRGFVAAIERNESRSFMLTGAAAMRPVRANLTVVWDSGAISGDIPDTMAEEWAAEARRIGFEFVADHAERYANARQAQAEARDKAAEERRKADEARAEWVADAAAKVPASAKAVIVAEYHRDESDSMSDYFSHKTERVLILGFSDHTRDLFPELRKAARNHPETAHLADAPESAEHREKWSMGGGYYLKTESRHSTGWAVRKLSIGGDTPEARAKSLPSGEWSLAAPAMASANPVPVGGFTIEKHTHTKRGFDMWICILPGRVDRAEFDRLRDAAEALGGWYSKPWGKTPGGFAFKVEADAVAFANAEPSAPEPGGTSPGGNTPPKSSPALGDRLRSLADAMQGDIDHKLGDRLTNTPKRQREAGVARQEGARLQRTQKGLRALADLHDAGTVPPELATVTSKKAAYDLARSIISERHGYYDSGHDTGKPALDTPAALAFWALIGGQSEGERKAEELRQKIEALQFANIPGYFPTPAPIVARMIEVADIPTGARILEPSAGSGAILDGLRAARPEATMQAVERHATLCEILRAKGYSVHSGDFTEFDPPAEGFDRVLMNPPFENGQDMEHVRHAFAFLKPGGRLVAIMSPGPFFRSDRKAQEFRAWFEEIGGTREDIGAGAFKASGTGVATVLVVMDKGEAETVAPPAPPSGRLTIGTSHFVSIATARDYYARQGDDAATVLDKLAEGAIHIGPPEVRQGQRVEIIPGEGRYSIVEG